MAKSIIWNCPDCSTGIESEGRDESSRLAIKTFASSHRDECPNRKSGN
jgi:hypothetical protein